MIPLRALLVVVATVASLLLAEMALRLLAPHSPGPEQLRAASILYVPSPHARHVLPRKARVVRPNARTVYRLNSLGYRGQPLADVRRPGITRMVVFGGSAAFDLGASDPDDWPHVAAGLIGAGSGRPVAIINAALPGHTVADSLGRLRARGAEFAPDIVLLYHGWNDIEELPDAATPVAAALQPNPQMTPAGPIDRWFGRHSALYARLRYAWIGHRTGLVTAGPEGRRPPAGRGALDRVPGLLRLGGRITAFVATAQALGATAVLVKQARLATAQTPGPARERIDYAAQGMKHDELVASFAEIDALIDRVSARTGAVVIDAQAGLAEGVAGDASAFADLFDDHVHLSRKGSTMLAGIIADRLIAHLPNMRPSPSSPR